MRHVSWIEKRSLFLSRYVVKQHSISSCSMFAFLFLHGGVAIINQHIVIGTTTTTTTMFLDIGSGKRGTGGRGTGKDNFVNGYIVNAIAHFLSCRVYQTRRNTFFAKFSMYPNGVNPQQHTAYCCLVDFFIIILARRRMMMIVWCRGSFTIIVMQHIDGGRVDMKAFSR
jgi:hypothetical protein